MIIETASQSLKLALPGLTGYRALTAHTAPWHLNEGHTPAEAAAWKRRMAAHSVAVAREHMATAYAVVRRYRADRRWGRSAINPEARPYLSAARTWLRQARRWFADAQAIDAAAMREAA
ncbi:MAG: hypothetical protein EBR82_31935 [Caulobacteraceae bacterium]|nr:hypothetical protein [Caulobacteraceae bacterium]